MRARTLVCALVVTGSLCGVGARGAAAQSSFRLLPSVGLYVPVSDIGQIQHANVEGVVEFGRAQSTLAFGLAGEFGSDEGASARLNLGYATASDIPIGGVGCETCSARNTLLLATLTIVLRPIPEVIGIQPYALLGGGIKRYNFDLKNFQEDGLGGALADQTQGAAQLGVGTDVNLLGLGLFTEVNAYFNGIDPIKEAAGISSSKLQADFVFSAGVALGG